MMTVQRTFLGELVDKYPDEPHRNEYIVALYLARRRDRPERIDDGLHPRLSGKGKPDWLVRSRDSIFLCEVKTITSSRRGDDHEGAYEKGFRRPIRDRFRSKKWANMPYGVMVHNQTMTVPDQAALGHLLEWLEASLVQLDRGAVPPLWSAATTPFNSFFTAEYRITARDGRRRFLSISVSPEIGGRLSIDVPSYGGNNPRPLQTHIENARKQLEDEAEFQQDPAMPKLAVIDIRGGLGFERSVVIRQVRRLFERY